MLSTPLIFVVMLSQSQSPLLADEEWVADGWEITNRETYVISEYVEPYSVTEDGIAEYFVELCFTEEGEFRAGIAGDSKVVFINENSSTLSMDIPDYLDISLSSYLSSAVVSEGTGPSIWSHYLVDEDILRFNSTDSFYFRWFFSINGNVAGIGQNNLIFIGSDGNLIRNREFQDRGLPAIVQWCFALRGDRIVILNKDDQLIEAYTTSGELLWSVSFLYATAGSVPLDVSDNGSCTAVSQVGNGFIVLNADGEFVNHYLEDCFVLSITVSPYGNYIAASVSPNVRGMPALYVFDIQDGTVTQIETPSEQWLPSVRSITDDGTLLCGYNQVSESDWGVAIRSRRLALYDNTGSLQWTSIRYDAIEVEYDNIVKCHILPVGINKGFADCLISNDNGYQLGYLDPVNGEIISIQLITE